VLGAHVDCPVCFERMLALRSSPAIRQARIGCTRHASSRHRTTDLDGYLVQIAAIDTTGQVVLDGQPAGAISAARGASTA
jgi:hypothetical protein